MAGPRVGIVRVNDLLSATSVGRYGERRLAELLERTQRDLKDLQSRADAARARAARGEATSALDADQLERDLGRRRREAEARIEGLRQAMVDEMLAVLRPLVDEIARAQGVGLVLSAPQAGLLYYAEELDLTQEVVQRFEASAARDPLQRRLDDLVSESIGGWPSSKARPNPGKDGPDRRGP